MNSYSCFDIIGSIMIGPSSSHTAGAARLGKIVNRIVGDDIKSATFYLNTSFSETYKGHGTDRALLAGVLGLDPGDERLKHSMDLAQSRGIKYRFEIRDLGDVHPNSVEFEIIDVYDNRYDIIGCSIGGGKILITEINGFSIEFSGDYPTLLVVHYDKPGVIADVTNVLKKVDINIGYMKSYRDNKGGLAATVIEIDSAISGEAVEMMKVNSNIKVLKAIVPDGGLR